MAEATSNTGKANGLGENKVKTFNANAVGDYKRGLQPIDGTTKIPSEMRKGAGAKQ